MKQYDVAVGMEHRTAPLRRAQAGEVLMVNAMRVAQWMESRRTPATPQDMVSHFGISRSTAYRWLRAYHLARRI